MTLWNSPSRYGGHIVGYLVWILQTRQLTIYVHVLSIQDHQGVFWGCGKVLAENIAPNNRTRHWCKGVQGHLWRFTHTLIRNWRSQSNFTADMPPPSQFYSCSNQILYFKNICHYSHVISFKLKNIHVILAIHI